MTEVVRVDVRRREGGRRHVPGEPELWIFVLGDLVVFGLFFGVMAWAHVEDLDAYQVGQVQLDRGLGLVNTLLLLTSSAMVASALASARVGATSAARRWYRAALVLGAGFVVVKALEYSAHIRAGYPLETDFFTCYFVFTGIHLFHVLVGLICLTAASRNCRGERPVSIPLLEGLGVYWHLVDVLWIGLFLVLYLV